MLDSRDAGLGTTRPGVIIPPPPLSLLEVTRGVGAVNGDFEDTRSMAYQAFHGNICHMNDN